MIDDQVIEKIAHLARLKIDQAESERLKKDMNRILGFMDKLNEVDTTDVEPLIYMTEEKNVLRRDVAGHQVMTQEALQNAPKHDGKYFRVSKVIDNS
ncbi:MAG TPA: Asp-tRNA(Asn)/Glu-tRNA(Gln) amidotransferase subunit GatC [Sphingobacteriaceae bacterium]